MPRGTTSAFSDCSLRAPGLPRSISMWPLKVGAVFNADARGDDVADDFAILLDLDAIAHQQIADGFAVDDDFARVNFGMQLRAAADGEPAGFAERPDLRPCRRSASLRRR